MLEFNNRPPHQEEADSSFTFAPIASKEAIMATMKRYPVLTREQINIAYGYKNSGQGLDALATDEAFNITDNPQDQELLQNALSDSRSITDLVVLCNLRLIAMVAARQHPRMEFEDVMQEGVFGLIQSAEQYNPELGAFSTYAVPGIGFALRYALRGPYAQVRLPSNLLNDINIGRKMSRELAVSLGREPTPDELVQGLIKKGKRVTEATRAVEIMQQNIDKPASLDRELFGEYSETTLGDVLQSKSSGPEEQVVEPLFLSQRQIVLVEIMNKFLTPREVDVLRMRFGFGSEGTMTQEQIGDKLGVSRGLIYQLEKRALEKLSKHPFIRELIEL